MNRTVSRVMQTEAGRRWGFGLIAGVGAVMLALFAYLALSAVRLRLLILGLGGSVLLPALLLPPIETALALTLTLSPGRSLSTQPIITLLVAVVAGRWLLATVLKGRYRAFGPQWEWRLPNGDLRFAPLPWLVIAFVGIVLAAYIHVPADYNYKYVVSVTKVITFVIFFVLVVTTVDDEAKFHRVLQGVMAVGVIVVIVGVLQLLFPALELNPALFPDKFQSTGETFWVSFRQLGNVSFFRISSLFTYVNSFAGALALLIPLQGYYLFCARSVRRRALYGVLIVASLVCFVATIDRSAWLSFGIGMIYFLFRSRLITPSRRALLFSTLGATIVLLGFGASRLLGTGYLVARFAELLNPEQLSSVMTRATTYQYTLKSWVEHPFLGHGVPQMMKAWPFAPLPLGSHSVYLYHLYCQGLIGLFLFVAILWVVWREAGFGRPRSPSVATFHGLREIIFLDVVIFTAHSLLISYEAGQGLYGLLVWTILGLAIAGGTITRRRAAA